MLGKRERVTKMPLRTATFRRALIPASRLVFIAQLLWTKGENIAKQGLTVGRAGLSRHAGPFVRAFEIWIACCRLGRRLGEQARGTLALVDVRDRSHSLN